MADRLQRLGGRRFVLALLVLVITSGLVYLGKLEAGAYATIMTASVCAYIAGDTFQRHSETRADVDKCVGRKGDAQ